MLKNAVLRHLVQGRFITEIGQEEIETDRLSSGRNRIMAIKEEEAVEIEREGFR